MVTYGRATVYPSLSSGGKIKPEILVMHTTEGHGRSYLDQLFSGRIKRDGHQKISVHWAIYLNGDIVEYAPWLPGQAVSCIHAGESKWRDRAHCNSWSLGYEIEHVEGERYPEEQVRSILFLNNLVKQQYPNMELVTHAQIAWPRGRKSDPTAPWKTEVWPRVQSAWNSEEDMAIDHVSKENAEKGLAALVKAKIVKEPKAHSLSDAAGVDLLWAIAGRLAELIEEKGCPPNFLARLP